MTTIPSDKLFEAWKQTCDTKHSFTDFCNILGVSPDEIRKCSVINIEVSTLEGIDTSTTEVSSSEPTSELGKYQKMISHFAGLGTPNRLLEKLYTGCEDLIELDTLAPYWNYVVTLNEPKMCLVFLKFFCKNIEAIKKSDSVVRALSFDVMKYMTASEETNLEEFVIFQIVHKWIQLVKPVEEITQSVVNNIRFPLIEAKKLVEDVQPSGLISDKAYIEALNHSVVPRKDANGEKFQFRKCETNFDFYLCSCGHVDPNYRMIKDEDFTSKFVSCFKNYISKNGGIPALSKFNTNMIHTTIRTNNQCLILNGSRMKVTDRHDFDNNEKCQIFYNGNLITNIDNMSVALSSDCNNASIGIFVKNGVEF